MWTANPLWGAPRIHGELLKLGVTVSQTTVAKCMSGTTDHTLKRGGSSWRTTCTRVGAAFFVVPTATCRLLFVLVLLAHGRCRIVHIAVTDHPTAAWTAQQLLEPVR